MFSLVIFFRSEGFIFVVESSLKNFREIVVGILKDLGVMRNFLFEKGLKVLGEKIGGGFNRWYMEIFVCRFRE